MRSHGCVGLVTGGMMSLDKLTGVAEVAMQTGS